MIFQVMLLMRSVGERASMGPLARDFDYVLFSCSRCFGTCNAFMNRFI